MQENLIRILLVGGSRADYASISQQLDTLKHSQYLPIWCEDINEALPQMISGKFDLALLDCPNNDQPTHGLIKMTRDKGSNLPIIAMTCDIDSDPSNEMVMFNNVSYIAKDDIKPYLLDRYIRDAIEREESARKLSELNMYDPLTGIPNRMLFQTMFERCLEDAKKDQHLVGLLMINLDGFKRVNQSFGHDAGDQLVMTMAKRLKRCVRKSDNVFRVAGDEFSLVIDDMNNKEDLELVAKKVIDILSAPVTINGNPLIVSCSIGIATFPDVGENVESLLKHANLAMVEAKGLRGSQFCFYNQKSNVQRLLQLNIENDLRRALRKGEFELYYQPRVHLVSGETVGMEGLIRWRHPERGLISPKDFIPIAEETGLIVPIGYWVIQQACQDMKLLDKQGCNPMDIAVNLSFKQLQDNMFVDTAARIIQQSGIDPHRLEFELTETAIMSNYQQTYEGMMALSQLGVTFSLDDFGTGFSSFAHIQRLPISALKVDRSFIRSVMKDNEDAIIVKAMINLAHSLKLKVVAEGVETLDQVQFLWQNHCDQVQGYYFSPAVAAKDFSVMVNQKVSMSI